MNGYEIVLCIKCKKLHFNSPQTAKANRDGKFLYILLGLPNEECKPRGIHLPEQLGIYRFDNFSGSRL